MKAETTQVDELPPIVLAEENSVEPILSEHGEQGGDTNSDLNASVHSSSNPISDSDRLENTNSAPNSSRGSTKDSGQDGTLSMYSARLWRSSRELEMEEEQKEEDGSPILTNKYLKELFKKEWRRYYRTPELNEKLYLHYKGFSYMKNMAQFTELKCLYFEGNGCKSLTGLETNVRMRSLFIQENMISKIEGLDNLKDLRQLNLNDNILEKVEGLANCDKLETIYLKGNRLGRNEHGDVDALKGLLERPTLTCIDIQDNNLDDPAIIEEILYKMPNLGVLYCSKGNKFTNKVSNFRKILIANIKTLKYVDDRPVFPEDRRRAEAFARGGIDEERKEMKLIKKEKDDAHWANHEAFCLMIKKAKEEKASEAEVKQEKKETMKEMMQKAREEKAKGVYKYPQKGEEGYEDTDEFFKQVEEKAKKRFVEKQAGIEHEEQIDVLQKTDIELENKKFNETKAQEYDHKKIAEAKRSPAEMPQSEIGATGGPQKIEEVNQLEHEEEEEDCPPELEEVDEETRRQEELEKTKAEK